jgi:hypothetical protein
VRWAAAGLLLAAVLLAGGCALVTATVGGAAAITATTVKATTKVTTATVATTGKVTAAAITSSGDVAALSMESAARLARAGMVVLVDSGSGAVFELPWQEGLQLHAALEANKLRTVYKAVKIFREGRVLTARLRKAAAAGPALRPGDVVELLR